MCCFAPFIVLNDKWACVELLRPSRKHRNKTKNFRILHISICIQIRYLIRIAFRFCAVIILCFVFIFNHSHFMQHNFFNNFAHSINYHYWYRPTICGPSLQSMKPQFVIYLQLAHVKSIWKLAKRRFFFIFLNSCQAHITEREQVNNSSNIQHWISRPQNIFFSKRA